MCDELIFPKRVSEKKRNQNVRRNISGSGWGQAICLHKTTELTVQKMYRNDNGRDNDRNEAR